MSITLHGSVAKIVEDQMAIGNYQSPEDLVYEAINVLVRQKINEGIQEGIADIDAGRCMELTPDNIEEVLAKPLSQW